MVCTRSLSITNIHIHTYTKTLTLFGRSTNYTSIPGRSSGEHAWLCTRGCVCAGREFDAEAVTEVDAEVNVEVEAEVNAEVDVEVSLCAFAAFSFSSEVCSGRSGAECGECGESQGALKDRRVGVEAETGAEAGVEAEGCGW